MSNNRQEQTSQKFVHQTIATVTESQTTKSSLGLYVFGVIFEIVPFLHIFITVQAKGILGFDWLNSFLFALALPFSLLSSGILLYIASNHIQELTIKKVIYNLSRIKTFVGVYFLIYTFIPMPNMPYFTYYVGLLFVTILPTILMFKLNKYLFGEGERLKTAFSGFFHFISSVVPGILYENQKEEYDCLKNNLIDKTDL